MSDTTSGVLPNNVNGAEESADKAAIPDGEREVKWKVVTKTGGLAPAQIIAGRLKAEGIPARAWQEGAGQAYGLTVGLLGTGYVIVPEPYLEQAKELLDSLDDSASWEDTADWDGTGVSEEE